MSRVLALRNRQRVRAVDTPLLRRIVRWALEERFEATDYELGIHLVTAEEMAAINESFLGHEGSTDVITFDHRDGKKTGPLHGELFISLDDAVAQAREFGTTWQGELIRYLLHGLLHLHGFDDRTAADRRKMKREEDRLVQLAGSRFTLRKLLRSNL